MYIVSTASPELRLHKRGGSVTERRRRSLHRRLPSGTPCPRVRLAYSLCQPRVVYHLPTPLILTIDRATSCRLLEYIRSAATTSRLVTAVQLLNQLRALSSVEDGFSATTRAEPVIFVV